MAGSRPTLVFSLMAREPRKNSITMVAITKKQRPSEMIEYGYRMPPTTKPATTTNMPMPGHWKFLRRLSIEVRRHAKSGPTPVRKSRNRPIGTIKRLNQTASRLIFSVENFSERTGNMVPQSTAKQLASSTRLLNRKLDSRETTLSSSASLLRNSRRSRISQTVAAMPMARNETKYFPMGDSANAWTELMMP